MLPKINGRVISDLRPLVAWLRRGAPGWLRNATAFFLLAFVSAVVLSWRDFSYSHTSSVGILTEKFEETKGAHKGLEAFILSGLGAEVDNKFAETNVTKGFIASFNALQDAMKSPHPDDAAPPGAKPGERLGLRVETKDTPEPTIADKYITNTDGEGFLFVPGMVVGASMPTAASIDAILTEAEKPGGVLSSVIMDSKRAAPFLRELLGVSVLDEEDADRGQAVVGTVPVQSYYLTSTGLIRLDRDRKGVGDVHEHYRLQFEPTNFFPERPYFWNTIDKPVGKGKVDSSSPKIKEVFNTTGPYIDYGGNGIVVTLSRQIEGATVKSGLFLDFALGDYAEKAIIKKIEGLHSFWAKVSWAIKGSEPVVVDEGGRLSRQTKADLAKRIKTRYENRKLSEISGKLFVLDSKEGRVAFTIPVGQATFDNPSDPSRPTSGKLLYCVLDLNKFQNRILLEASIIGGSVMGFACCALLLLLIYKRRWREQERALEDFGRVMAQAFESFGRVMAQAPIAYCRVDESDRFIEMNKAFAPLLGYESLEAVGESLADGQTFEGLLADNESRQEYEYIRAMRRSRVPTGPYQVRFLGKEGVVSARVYGGTVPMPKSHPEAIPQTFGIVLEDEEKRQVTPSLEMIVAPLFGPPRGLAEPAALFVLMRFKDEFYALYESIETVGRHLTLDVKRSDRVPMPGSVMLQVWAYINAARVIVADCTGHNPNVFYEIGIAHVLGKPVILITQDEKNIPFDIVHLQHIPYRVDTHKAVKEFERKLEDAVKAALGLGKG